MRQAVKNDGLEVVEESKKRKRQEEEGEQGTLVKEEPDPPPGRSRGVRGDGQGGTGTPHGGRGRVACGNEDSADPAPGAC